MNITIQIATASLTLEGQLLDNSGVPVGTAITTGFVELGDGTYVLSTAVDVDFEGMISIYESGVPGTILGGSAINVDSFAQARNNAYPVGSFGESFTTIISGATLLNNNTIVKTFTTLTVAIDDFYVGRTIVWTSGTLQGVAAAIIAYDGTTKALTHTEIVDKSYNGDTFLIV